MGRSKPRYSPASARGTSIARWMSSATPASMRVTTRAQLAKRSASGVSGVRRSRRPGWNGASATSTLKRPFGPLPSSSEPVATTSSSSSGRKSSASTPSRQVTSAATCVRAAAIGAESLGTFSWKPATSRFTRPLTPPLLATAISKSPCGAPARRDRELGQRGQVEARHRAAQRRAVAPDPEVERQLGERVLAAREPGAAVALDPRAEAAAPRLELQAQERPGLAREVAHLDPAVDQREAQARQRRQVEVGGGAPVDPQHRRGELPVARQILTRQEPRPGLHAARVRDLEQRGVVRTVGVGDPDLLELDLEPAPQGEIDPADRDVLAEQPRQGARHEVGVRHVEEREHERDRDEPDQRRRRSAGGARSPRPVAAWLPARSASAPSRGPLAPAPAGEMPAQDLRKSAAGGPVGDARPPGCRPS